MITLGAQALWCLAYGIGLFVSDPTWRVLFEALVWVGMIWLGPTFLAFGLDYTGRGHLIQTRSFRSLLTVSGLVTVVTFTYPYSDLLWTDFRLVGSLGISTVLYTIQPLGYATIFFGVVCASVGILLLIETVVSYGPLYRREAVAITLSTLPPAIGFAIWMTGVGPYPDVFLVPPLFLAHVGLDAYAFVGTNIFETNPTTMRSAERTAIDDLPNPIVIVDTDERIVELNTEAEALFDCETNDVLYEPLSDRFDVEIGPDGRPTDEIQTIPTRGERSDRTFSISTTALTEPAGATVGRTIVLQDVTTELERKQQLTVLNRILRHNLRNEMTVIMGAADVIESVSDHTEIESWLGQLRESGRELIEIGERAHEFERVRQRDLQLVSIDIDETLSGLARDVRDRYPDATTAVERTESATVRTDPEILEVVLTNLLENALVHNDDDDPTVAVRGCRSDDSQYIITIEDNGSGIPEDELAVLDEGAEDALDHGSGLGLWIVSWGIDAVGGEVQFETSPAGTTVTVSVPT
ncbi:PAS domain-containing protein [Halopiger aswanensis]|uniref:histidine kinase n=2 Tax=Halopiger aswanensis TaxID=148449 RepID=A0A419W0T7_9EURY|nr:PAS domain-containing protein [Halopiger aswanensis]